MNLSQYELVFGQKPKRPIMFNLSPTTDTFRNCKPSLDSTCNYLPQHTHFDHLGHHPQIKQLQKEIFTHWFLNLEKIHSEVYKRSTHLFKPEQTFTLIHKSLFWSGTTT